MFFFTLLDGAGVLPALLQSRSRRLIVLAKTSRKKKKVSVKEMKFRHDPMIRFYEKTQEWLQEKGRPFAIAVGIIAGIIVLYAGGSYFFDYRKARAENAFAEAVEKFNAPVQDSSTPTTTPASGKTYG